MKFNEFDGTKAVFNFEDVVFYTGFSKSWLYKLTSNGSIPFSKPSGKMMFFYKEDVDKWLMQNRSLDRHEIESKSSLYLLKGGRK